MVSQSEQKVTFASSVFSAMLWTLVDIQDPCAPNTLFMVVVGFITGWCDFTSSINWEQAGNFMHDGGGYCHWLMWFYFSSKLRADKEFYAVILLSFSCFMFGTVAYLSLLYREVTLHQLYYGQHRLDWDLQDAWIWSFNRVLRGLD